MSNKGPRKRSDLLKAEDKAIRPPRAAQFERPAAAFRFKRHDSAPDRAKWRSSKAAWDSGASFTISAVSCRSYIFTLESPVEYGRLAVWRLLEKYSQREGWQARRH